MSIQEINNNPIMLQNWVEKEKRAKEEYLQQNPQSLIPLFEEELRKRGFHFEITNQIRNYMPKHKKAILPIAIEYYRKAKELGLVNEQHHFMGYFQYKGFEELVPMLLEDFYSEATSELTRWIISDCLYQICSKKYTEEYLDIISKPQYGRNRQMFILLIGRLKAEDAIPILINLLEDEEVRLQVIKALGEYRREEFRIYFMRYVDSKQTGWKKYAKAAIAKLDRIDG